MAASCVAFRRAFSSVEIYLQLAVRGCALASACTYSGLYMNIPGTLVPLLEGLERKVRFNAHAIRFPRKITSRGQLSQFILSFLVYDAW